MSQWPRAKETCEPITPDNPSAGALSLFFPCPLPAWLGEALPAPATMVLGQISTSRPDCGLLSARPHPTSCLGGSGPSPRSLTSSYRDQRSEERSRRLRWQVRVTQAVGKLIYHRFPSSAAASSGQKQSKQTHPPALP